MTNDRDRRPMLVRAGAVRQRLWRGAAPHLQRALRESVPWLLAPAGPGRGQPTREVRVIGLLSTATGIGRSARLCVAELKRAGLPVSTCSLSRLFGVDQGIAFDVGSQDAPPQAAVSIHHLNPPLMLLGLIASGVRRYRRDLNVGYWAWELPELPPEWLVGLRYVDAVLVPSTFCRAIVARRTSKPVIVVPHPVECPATAMASRESPSRQRPFRVLTVFNCGSSLYRKNPMALIDAFKRAFGDDGGAELILKVADGAQHRADMAELERRIGGACNIRIVDQLMDAAMLDRLMRSADVYASLHRSEGFGLTVAEAIMREVPVVVTDWSGTTDYCTPGLAYVVDCTQVPVVDPHPAYSTVRGAHWAEPSVEAAAHRLAEIRANPDEARRRAAELKRRLVAHIAGNGYARAVEALRDGAGAARHHSVA